MQASMGSILYSLSETERGKKREREKRHGNQEEIQTLVLFKTYLNQFRILLE